MAAPSRPAISGLAMRRSSTSCGTFSDTGSTTSTAAPRPTSTPSRTPASRAPPSTTTASCTRARRRPGTCATGTCSTRCSTSSIAAARAPRRWCGRTTPISATPPRPPWAGRASSTSANSCRTALRDDAVLIGFGTDRGTVAAASDWDEPMEVKQVRPSRPDSHERVFLETGVRLLAHRHPRRRPRAAGGPLGAAARARHRRRLSPGDRALQPLFRGGAGRAVRRLRLVRGDARRHPPAGGPRRGRARDLPVRRLSLAAGALACCRGFDSRFPRFGLSSPARRRTAASEKPWEEAS